MACKAFLIICLLKHEFVPLVATAESIIEKFTPYISYHDCGIFPMNDVSTVQRSIEILQIINSSSMSADIGNLQQPLGKVVSTLNPGSCSTSNVGISSSRHLHPTSIIDVANPRAESYSLNTGKTVGYFNHNIRGRLESQLVVTANDPKMLLSVLKQGPGIYIQTERSYWHTFSRIVLHFIQHYDEESV